MIEKDIEAFIEKLNYWQKVNLQMCAFYLDNPEATRNEAYNSAIDHLNNRELSESLNKMVSFTSTIK